VELRRYLTLVTVVIIISLAVITWLYPSHEDFRVGNNFWNGSREIQSSHAVSPLESLSDLPSSPQDTALILIPYLDFTPAELDGLTDFVSLGGTLVLADDFGYGNRILEHLGLKTRFSRRPILDPLSNYRNRWFPRIAHINQSPLTDNIEGLILNHATCLVDVESNDIIAMSSAFSFIDRNGNETWDSDEPAGPLPVISRHVLGRGQIVLISDPSIFINSMTSMGSNETFLDNIAAAATSGLYIDQSHLPPSNLHQTKSFLAQARSLLANPLELLLIVIPVMVVTLIPVWHNQTGRALCRKGEDSDH